MRKVNETRIIWIIQIYMDILLINGIILLKRIEICF